MGTLAGMAIGLARAYTRPDQIELLLAFKKLYENRSPQWAWGLRTWTCPPIGTCDPCGPDWRGNWDHMYCRGPAISSINNGIYDGYVTNIHLCDLHLTGPVPQPLCVFSHLREFDMDGSCMTGPIPDWFPKCFKDLVELDLSFNCLSGGLPRNVHELEYLEEFKVENNFTLGGPLIPEFSKMKHIYRLRFAYNEFTGGIPEEWVAISENLNQLTLAANKLEGNLYPVAKTGMVVTSVHMNPGLCGMVPQTIRWAKDYNEHQTNLGKPCPNEDFDALEKSTLGQALAVAGPKTNTGKTLTR